MGYSLLKTVFPKFGDTSTFVEHNYKQFLDEKDNVKSSFQPKSETIDSLFEVQDKSKLEADSLQKEIQYMSIDEVPKKNSETIVLPPQVTISRIENFDEPSSHIDYAHIMSCKQCRELLQKEFANKDNLIDDSLLEIGMYILFGAFILVLLEQK